jgi:zinc D-Ala-D-Ala carboxypeptidase
VKYFTTEEFDSPDIPGSGEEMCASFCKKLDAARELAGIPFKINSGYRSKEWNLKVGGRPGSSHLKGCAADIHCTTSYERSKILRSLIEAGFTRCGVAKTFIHVDNDSSKNDAIWLY